MESLDQMKARWAAENDLFAPIALTRIGNTGRAFQVNTRGQIYKIRTTSPRRYIVVDGRGKYVVKRTDNLDTARRAARKLNYNFIIDAVNGELV